MNYILEVQKISKSFQKRKHKTQIFKKLSFSLLDGESLAIIGPSGSGKSTLLHLLGGLDRPTEGKIVINKQDLNTLSDNDLSIFRNETIGFVFQFFYLLDYLTVEENVALPLFLRSENKLAAKEKAAELLDHFGLSHIAKSYPNQISGGEMQRASVARALIGSPKIILADEPTGNLDKDNAAKVLDAFDEIAKSGVSVVVITHDDWIARRFSNVLNLREGKLVD